METLTLIGILALAALPTSDAEERLEFIGFSTQEDSAVWRVRVKQPQGDGEVDRFTLIRVINTKTREVIGHIRQGRIRRHDRLGRKAKLAPRPRLETENPMWGNALPASHWRRARRKVRFTKKHHDIKQGSVRFVPSTDSHITLDVKNKTLIAVSDAGSPIGLTPQVRLFDGRQILLTPIRIRGVPNRVVRAEIDFYHSVSALHIAYVVRLTSLVDGQEKKMDFGRIFALPGSPLGTDAVGTMRHIATTGKVMEKDWAEMHPDTAEMYKHYVGSWGDY